MNGREQAHVAHAALKNARAAFVESRELVESRRLLKLAKRGSYAAGWLRSSVYELEASILRRAVFVEAMAAKLAE